MSDKIDSSFLNSFYLPSQSIAERFSIYRHNNRVGLIKALAEIYPVCQCLVGAPFFRMMVGQYVQENPSTVLNLNDYGKNFSSFLQTFPRVTQLPYLADVAQLEWNIHRVLLGPDDMDFNWARLADILPERIPDIVLHFRQNAILLYSVFPVDRIWETNQPDFTGNITIDLEIEAAVHLIIWRSGFDLRIDRLDPAQWNLLSMVDSQSTLGQLAEKSSLKEQNMDIITLLPDLIKKGYIERFTQLD